jgi:hypothetical protein
VVNPGDRLQFPDGSEWIFLHYFDDMAIIVGRLGAELNIRAACESCTPKLAEYRIKTQPNP